MSYLSNPPDPVVCIQATPTPRTRLPNQKAVIVKLEAVNKSGKPFVGGWGGIEVTGYTSTRSPGLYPLQLSRRFIIPALQVNERAVVFIETYKVLPDSVIDVLYSGVICSGSTKFFVGQPKDENVFIEATP